jgi:ABC-type antimicrobial peptide transport system permease subunit
VFQLSYARRELRRRLGRTILTALGLALGVGLVIGIIGVSQGLDDAQHEVLRPLSSVGTDILVTRVVGDTSSSSGSSTSTTSTTVANRANGPDAGPGGGGFFGGGRNSGLDQADAQALQNENKNVLTDLASLGKPGDKFTKDFFLSATLLSFPQQAVAAVAKTAGVDSAVGGLVQLAEHQTGTVPQIVATLQTGGQTVTQTVRPDPMTDAERTAFEACVQSKGGSTTPTTRGGSTTPAPGGDGGGGGFGGGGRRNPAFEECLPQRFREFRASFTTPLQTIRQVVDPPTTDIQTASYTAAGVDPAHPSTGLVTTEQLTKGSWLKVGATSDVLVNEAYANKQHLAVGATMPINGTDYKVVGLVRPTLTGSTADVYFPLATLQKLAGKDQRVTQVLVKATSASAVPAVVARIKKLLPGAEVVTASSLAGQVSGSLADAHDLASRFGGVLSVIVLLAAFTIAALLTLGSIAKRVREIGTLRAIGWSKGRVVRQLVGETVGIGVIGGIIGIGVGALLALGVSATATKLTATGGSVPGQATSTAAALFNQTQATVTRTVSLHAPIHPSTLVLGVVFALIGGLLAGIVGGWRAARLSPAVALRDLG